MCCIKLRFKFYLRVINIDLANSFVCQQELYLVILLSIPLLFSKQLRVTGKVAELEDVASAVRAACNK